MSQTSLSAQPAAQQAKTSSPQSCTEIRPLVGWASKPSLEGSRRISLAQHLISERVQQDLKRVSTSHLYAIHEWCEIMRQILRNTFMTLCLRRLSTTTINCSAKPNRAPDFLRKPIRPGNLASTTLGREAGSRVPRTSSPWSLRVLAVCRW